MQDEHDNVPADADEAEAEAFEGEGIDEMPESEGVELDEVTDEVAPESEEGDNEPSIGEAVREAHAEQVAEVEGDEPPAEVTEDGAAAEGDEPEAEVVEVELYDEDGFPVTLPEDLREYFVTRDEREDGPWRWVEQPGLDIDVETVQELAYELLITGISWKRAMFGGTVPSTGERTSRVGKRGGISHGRDGRWFASPMDVVDAAAAHRREFKLPDWRKTRQRGAA